MTDPELLTGPALMLVGNVLVIAGADTLLDGVRFAEVAVIALGIAVVIAGSYDVRRARRRAR